MDPQPRGKPGQYNAKHSKEKPTKTTTTATINWTEKPNRKPTESPMEMTGNKKKNIARKSNKQTNK